MLHSVFTSFWFCIIYLIFHISPSPRALDLHDYFADSTTYQTTSSQFTSLDTLPLSFLITRRRSRFNHAGSLAISILILLSGDIQPNPGPASSSTVLNVCTINIRSLTNPRHYTALVDLAETHNIHVFPLTETWIHPNNTPAEIFDAIPHGFSFISNPRPVPPTCTSSVVGGGTAFLIRDPCTLLSSPSTTFKSF